MYFLNGVKTKVVVELFGGPHDGTRVCCPQAPPPLFLLPTDSDSLFTIYQFDSLDQEGRENIRLKYAHRGEELVAN